MQSHNVIPVQQYNVRKYIFAFTLFSKLEYFLIPTSSLDINSLLKVRPGIKPLFFNQKMAAKLPLKNIPSTAANATTRSGNVALS